jgi:pyrroline-5-carboxylate reductase
VSILASQSIGVIGAGNMAEALIRGLVRGGHVSHERIAASTPRKERRDELAAAYKIAVHGDNRAVARGANIVVFAVKPQILDKVLREVGNQITAETLVVSICAGVDTETIETTIAGAGGAAELRVVRAMPNTPALVGAGATAISPGRHAREEDLATARVIFDAIGISVILDEGHLDAVTGLSGSGPAYIFLILEALADAGVKVGLSRRNAQRLAAQTVMGSAKLLLETDEHPGRLKDMVTSPGGTAIAGLHTLEEGGLRTTLINAVETATKRARELGRGGK